VSDPTPIEDVRDRVRDFTNALRGAGAEDVARRIDGYADGFVDTAQVRRAVDAIRQQLRHFRAYPEELPDSPVVHIAANRLEDACKDALRAGRIAPAQMTLIAHGKRKLIVVLKALALGAVSLLILYAIAAAGVDLNDLRHERHLPSVELPRSGFVSTELNVLEAAPQPDATRGVEFYVAGACPAELSGGASCHVAGPKAFGSIELPAYEVMLSDQAYGVHVAFAEARLVGGVGHGRAYISAGPETPEGVYSVPLSAAYLGFAPERCGWYRRLLSQCAPAQRGPEVRDEDRPVPTLIVKVVPARQNAAEVATEENRLQRQRAEARATQISGAVQEIQAVLDDTQGLLRAKRFDTVQARIDKLTSLFEPLDTLAVVGSGDALPVDVVALRARFETQRRELTAFHDRAFEVAYTALSSWKGSGPRPSDDVLLAKVAAQLAISPEHLERIYAEHAEQLEQRLQHANAAKEQAEQQAMAAVIRRCGTLPKSAFHEVEEYLTQLTRRSGGKLHMQECLTPRLSPKTCWSVVCGFEEVTPVADALFDNIARRKWTFRLRSEHVVGHVDHVEEAAPAATAAASGGAHH